MQSVLYAAAGFLVGGAAGALAAYLTVKYWHKPLAPISEGTNQEPEYPLPPNRHKFRVVYYTQQGARARDMFEDVEEELSRRADYQEIAEFWHFGEVRSRTYGTQRD